MAPPTKDSSKTLAIVSLIAGIASYPFISVLIFPAVSIICGLIAIKGEPDGDWDGKGMAKAGIILGIINYALLLIGCCCFVLYYIFVVVIMGGAMMMEGM
jgi:hypothetical protein